MALTATPQEGGAAPALNYTLPELPEVTCFGGQLTVNAQDATFSSTVAAVANCLGVAIKLPGNAGDERTFLHLGPGPAMSVLDDLLSSSDFNYAIVLAPGVERKVAAVVLTSRMADNIEANPDRLGAIANGTIPLTAARRLWLASQASTGRPAGGGAAEPEGTQARTAEDAAAEPGSNDRGAGEPDTRGATAATAAVPGSAAGLLPGSNTRGIPSTDPTASTDPQSAQPEVPATATAPAVAAASPASTLPPGSAPNPSDAGSDAKSPQSVLSKQIDQMQQMFEQRKKLNTPQPPTSADPQ